MADPRCKKCNDTGVEETGNNDLPCDCPAGATALFNVAGVEGPITGEEMRRHFLNGSPEPIELGRELFLASNLPGRHMEKDLCVICGKETEYARDTHVDQREDYIEGAGQLCKECNASICSTQN